MTLASNSGFAQGDLLPEALGGLPANAPHRPATPYATPNVYEVRPTRPVKPLTQDEQKKLEAELTALRERQKNRANPPPAAPKKAAAGPLNLAKPAQVAKPAPVVKPAPKPAPVAKRAPAPSKAAPVKKKEAAKPEIVPDSKRPAGPMRLIN
jgi:hypothetical protein